MTNAPRFEHVGGCNEGCRGDDHLLISETPAGGHDSRAVAISGPVEREAATVPPAGINGAAGMSDPLAPYPCVCGRQDTVLVAFKRNSSLLVRRFRDMPGDFAADLRCTDCIADMAAEVALFAWPNEPDYEKPA